MDMTKMPEMADKPVYGPDGGWDVIIPFPAEEDARRTAAELPWLCLVRRADPDGVS